MYSVGLYVFLVAISVTSSALVKWLPSTSFNLAINFENGKLPCSGQTVVFPEIVKSSVTVESGTSVSGFILPLDGEILLAEGVIEFGLKDDTNCTDTGNAYYIDRSESSWTSPGVWSSSKFTKVTPDAERVPCFDDVVEFPENKDFAVSLPDYPQKVRELRVGGRKYDTYEFRNYVRSLSDQSQQFYLNVFGGTGVKVQYEACKSPAGCFCQDHVLDIKCQEKFCPAPSCFNPVQPEGHCCKICGGFVAFNINSNFRLSQLKECVVDTLSSYGADDFIYHIGRIPDNKVQVIIMEVREYTGVSAEVVNTIVSEMKRHLSYNMQLSGIPLSKSGESMKLFVSGFFVVTLVMAIIYVYFYKLPEIRYNNVIPNFGRNNFTIFSRFDRRSESVVSLTRRGSAAPVAAAGPRSFRNPLYSSMRSNVSVDESINEE